MARLGTNVSADGNIPLALIEHVGARSARMVARQPFDLRDYLAGLRAADIRVWMVLARESFHEFSSHVEGIDFFAERYGDLVDMWEVGNEPDIVSDSSWTMAHGTFSRLLATARERLGPSARLCAGGQASGHPGWLGGEDPAWMTDAENNGVPPPTPSDYEMDEHGKPVRLDFVDALAIHPYGQVPGPAFPGVPNWYFGRVPICWRRTGGGSTSRVTCRGSSCTSRSGARR